MNIRDLHESQLKRFAKISTNMRDADFWLTRKGSNKTVGKPTREYSPEHIGIKVTATDKILPDYLYYVFEHLHTQGYWQQHSAGALDLQHIRIEDVRDLAVGFQ